MIRKYLSSARLALPALTALFISAGNASGDTGTSEDSTVSNEGSAPAAQGAVAPPNLGLIVGNGYLFRVWKNESASHLGAAIAVVRTASSRNPADVRYGLFFMQRNTQTGDSGEAMLCPEANWVMKKSVGTPDDALSCSQEVGATKETLTVGTLNSEFCTNLRKDQKKGEHIATDDQCEEEFPHQPRQCVCYDIVHTPVSNPKSGGIPPTNGSGSGGRGGG